MRMYAVQGNLETVKDGWTSSRQLPTFYLHPSVQGIVDEEHAGRVARDLLEPFAKQNNATLYLSVVAIDLND